MTDPLYLDDNASHERRLRPGTENVPHIVAPVSQLAPHPCGRA